MVHTLQLALPSQGELIEEARQRIQARITARKQRGALIARIWCTATGCWPSSIVSA